ncbi:zinc binding domain%3B DNA primase%2CPhage P4-associated%3B Replicative helicase RepA%2C Phage P4-associated [Yersinia enterocolitica]|nr:zinc binding domain%3B DNA primase%2CPhage P4-associated%3B Replicative helicase RepA%2C Phage P4-associated [Yersinia enterocolitica]CRY05257.1 zinc binding domain%3B DNA primase%2CPhage P4-associated%3B Replicative helicase RepA%2C Phage P4-associated [Yersinia enterocolitica]
MTYSSLIRLPEVLKRTGFSRPWIYKLLKQKRFPPPIKIGGRAIAFVESEVNDWIEQQIAHSREAMGVKRDADPLYGFCAHIVELGEAVGMYMGTLVISPRAPRIYLYHAYLAYMEAYGHQRSLSLTKFGKDFPKVMKEFGAEYKKARTDKGFRYNMDLSDTANDWLPALALPHHSQPGEPPY